MGRYSRGRYGYDLSSGAECRLSGSTAQVPVLAPLINSRVTLGRLIKFFQSLFFHLLNGEDNYICFTGLF